MADTPYHEYSQPDRGTENWDKPINANFAALDTDVELRDSGTPGSNNYDPKVGAKYLDTASGVVYVGESGANGPEWTASFALARYDANADEVTFSSALGVGTLTGSVTGGTAVSNLAGTGLSVTSGSLGLANDSVTVAGNSVSLGGSTGISHADLSNITSSDHHTRPSAGDGLTDNSNTFAVGAGAYLSVSSGAVAFDAPAEWNGSGQNLAFGSDATVAGGINNEAQGGASTVGGGDGNIAGVFQATIAGGANNSASGFSAAIGGGNDNTASSDKTTVAGGRRNTASGTNAAVGGGFNNTASGQSATVPGGEDNTAGGRDSLAVGRNATASDDGALLFADSTSTELPSSGTDQARFQMPVYLPELNGGVTGNTAVSSLTGTGLAVSSGALAVSGVPNGALANSSVTVTAGDGLKNGGSVSLGGSTTLAVEPSDFAGNGLEDDGSDNLAVSSGGIGTSELASGAVTASELATPFADLATLFGDPISTGGTVQSSGALTVNTDGSNGGSRALELGVPKKGDMDFFEAGGNFIAGHPSNTVNNDARGVVIGGGGAPDDNNVVNKNTAGADWATVSGGKGNTASGKQATVGGGAGNEASANGATVPGGTANVASGSTSFAAGYRAKATNDNTFVWADSSASDFSSTGADQFLVEASGGTGIGTNDPVTTFHVQDSVAESGSDNLGRHVAAIENTSSSSSPVPDVLGLELTNVTDPDEFNSYISFMDSSGTIGNIQGDGNGGVAFTGSTADFAEFFPKADSDREFEDGTVVGLDDGEVVALDTNSDPDAVLVVSTAPLVAGNRPIDEDERDAYVKLSLVGQVPVRVSASVDHGDVLVASPADGETAIPRSDCDETGRPVVGMALAEGEAGEQVLALIGGPDIDATPVSEAVPETPGHESADGSEHARKARVDELETELDENSERIETLEDERGEREERIDELEAENERLRERNAELEDRLAAVEAHLGLDGSEPAQGVAGD